jgi:hypothetical protein
LSEDRIGKFNLSAVEEKQRDYSSHAPLLSLLVNSHLVQESQKNSLWGIMFIDFESIYKKVTLRKARNHKQGSRLNGNFAGEEDDAWDDTEDEPEHLVEDGPDFSGEDLPQQEQPLTIGESTFEQVPETYSDLVRAHVAKFVETARNWASETRLSMRVRGWHDYLEPILEEQENRPHFDLREYEQSLLDELQSIQKTQSEDTVPFEKIVLEAVPSEHRIHVSADTSEKEYIPRWDVCRLFLTTLELANQGSVIIDDTGLHIADTEVQFSRRSSESLAVSYSKPQRQHFGKVVAGGKKKALRRSDPGSEFKDKENLTT